MRGSNPDTDGAFKELRMFAGGQLCEDIAYHGSVAVMLDRLMPAARRLNDSLEASLLPIGTGDNDSSIPGAASRRMQCPLILCLLHHEKWFPQSLINGLVIEIEITATASNASKRQDPIGP